MKNKLHKILNILCALLCVCVVVSAYIFATSSSEEGAAENLQVITVWQIDSFEGGKGSRAEYLRSQGESFAKNNNVYIDVTAISADAARSNLENGVVPDIISYGAGTYGIESFINENYPSKVWCRGGYCLLSTETDDFTKADSSNTVINAGKDNLISAVSLLCGLENADVFQPTSAYVKLINGDYKYLLGTQRDIVRLITRGVNFYVYPITLFNDLYQYISVLCSGVNGTMCNKFIEYLISKNSSLSSLCLFYDGLDLYENQLSEMEGLTFEYTVPSVVSKKWINSLKEAAEEKDTDKLKSLL